MGTTYQVICDRCSKSYLTTDDTPPLWCGCGPWPEPPVTYEPPFRNKYPVTCSECGKVFRKVPGPGPHWCGCPHDLYKFLHECVGCGSSFVRGQGEPPWCSVQCKNAVQRPRAELEAQLEKATELLARLSDRFACAACHASSHVAVKGNACACGYSDVITFLRKARTDGD